MTAELSGQTDTFVCPLPHVAPFGIPVSADGVREVWDAYIESDGPQSVETRMLMAILRAVHQGLRDREEEVVSDGR